MSRTKILAYLWLAIVNLLPYIYLLSVDYPLDENSIEVFYYGIALAVILIQFIYVTIEAAFKVGESK